MLTPIYRYLGLLWAAISIALLTREAFELGPLNGPFATVVSYTEFIMSFLFSVLEPFAERLGQWLLRWVNVDLVLGTHWKYVYTLIFLYVGAQSAHAWQAGHRFFAMFRCTAGVAVGFVGSAAIGVLPFDAKASTILLPIVLGLTFCIYQLFNNFWIQVIWRNIDLEESWPGFRFSVRYPIYFVAIGGLASILALLSENLADSPLIKNSSAIALLSYVLLLIAFWYGLGLFHALRLNNKGNFVKSLAAEGPTVLATLMIQAVVGAVFFLAANAGWSVLTTQ